MHKRSQPWGSPETFGGSDATFSDINNISMPTRDTTNTQIGFIFLFFKLTFLDLISFVALQHVQKLWTGGM
jgi:hypothetical protein